MPTEKPVFRFLAIAGFAALAGVAIWSSLPQPLSLSDGHDSRIVQAQANESEQRARVLRASFMRTEADQIAAARGGKANCKPGDVSAAEMEIILQEMIRRGWQPPSRAMALADLRMTSGSALFPLDPLAPMPRRYSQMAETEDGPIPPVPADAFQSDQPIVVTSPVTQPGAPSAAQPAPASPPPSAAELITAPRPSPN